jgi:hypothetical protein
VEDGKWKMGSGRMEVEDGKWEMGGEGVG